MPVIVIGADTTLGRAVVTAIAKPGREVRVFISDPDQVEMFRELGVKVALGDLSDTSHIEAAASGCFTAVMVSSAASDGRMLAFAHNALETFAAWAEAVAKNHRAIWIGPGATGANRESRSIDPAALSDLQVARMVADLDEAETI